jgi:hypothetical protein
LDIRKRDIENQKKKKKIEEDEEKKIGINKQYETFCLLCVFFF